MQYPQSVTQPRRLIYEIINSLERYGRYDFHSDGFVRIERWSAVRALEAYRHTLTQIRGSIEGETPSATMVTDAHVEWEAEPAEIGYRVRQRHIGTIRPEVRPLVEAWIKAGKPFPSSGAFYHTTPNKSYTRVSELQKYPELRDVVLNLGLTDRWLDFWEHYIPYRHDVSSQLLSLLSTDEDALSRGNAEAGTGLQIRGMRLKRKDLSKFPRDLEFLLPYSVAMAASFAAVQIAHLEPDQVWMVKSMDNRIKGAIAARSDMDVVDVAFDGERLTISGLAQTRQAGSDCTGTLTNSATEKKLMRESVTEHVLRQIKDPKVEYPFTSRETLLQLWGLDAKPFPNKQYVIAEDLGLVDPIKSPADALFSRGFMSVGSKVMPMMLSGSSWTQAVYSVFQNHFASKLPPSDKIMALGDDINLITSSLTDQFFAPYIKVKTTDPKLNTKKILGLFTAFSQQLDPEGKEPAIIGVVPRVIKTLSSAARRGGYWSETLSRLPVRGQLDLVHPDQTEEVMKQDIKVLLPYLGWSGQRRALTAQLNSLWGRIPTDIWKILITHDEELEHRLSPEEVSDSEGP